jgi:hypothetical protein
MLLLLLYAASIALPAGAFWLLLSRLSAKPFVIAGALGLLVLIVLLWVAHAPAPALENPVDAIKPGAWPRAGIMGVAANWLHMISLLVASLGLGALLGAWGRTGEIQRWVSIALSFMLAPATWLFGFLTFMTVACSYTFNQIGHACY